MKRLQRTVEYNTHTHTNLNKNVFVAALHVLCTGVTVYPKGQVKSHEDIFIATQ